MSKPTLTREHLEAEVLQEVREIYAQGEKFPGEFLGRVKLLRDTYERRFRDLLGLDVAITFWILKGEAKAANGGCPLKPYFIDRSTL